MLLITATIALVAAVATRRAVARYIEAYQEEENACRELLDDPIANLRVGNSGLELASDCDERDWSRDSDSGVRSKSKAGRCVEVINRSSSNYRSAEAAVAAFTRAEHCPAHGIKKTRSRVRSGFGF